MFNQARGYWYDYEADVPERVKSDDNHFQAAGRSRYEPPLLMPVTDPEDIKNHATVLSSHGDVVKLPNDILVPFARLAARASTMRIKWFHITNVYQLYVCSIRYTY